MARRSSNGDSRSQEENVVVAVDKDRGSQYALKWAVDTILDRGQRVTLLHIKQKPSSIPTPTHTNNSNAESYKEMFLPFRCFCTRKEIKCEEVIMEEGDISKAILDYVNANLVTVSIFGAPSKSSLVKRFRTTDIPSTVSKVAPEFCTIHIINKGKVTYTKHATVPPPVKNSMQHQMMNKASGTFAELTDETPYRPYQILKSPVEKSSAYAIDNLQDIEIKSPFTRKKVLLAKLSENSLPESDISFLSSGRSSTDHSFPSFSGSSESGITAQLSIGSDFDYRSFGSSYSENKSIDMMSPQYNFSENRSIEMSPNYNFSLTSQESGTVSWSSQSVDAMETEMRRLRQELKQRMDLYSTACKEALTAKQKSTELHRWKLEEQQRLEQARLAEEAALALAEREKAKCRAAIEAAEAAKRKAELEAQKRKNAEMKASREAEEMKMVVGSMTKGNIRYRRYTIEEIEAATKEFSASLKIGEGGYGPVYRGYLDHTPVAIKVLRPDAAQGRAQFQQEVEVLSCIRHPNMVLLLGACPEYGCLVYEYMSNGSLDDCLTKKGNSPPLSWQTRFRIAAEIATGLLFLHQTKPEPIVHRDLKPGNILLDRNYVSKISDVGLARLVPPSVADTVTQYRVTSTAGTFCYIDPEYQQTGMLGIKSDVYSLGIILLQLITAKPPMGLAHHVERAIEKGTFVEILDQTVADWPVGEALKLAKLALQCAELRKKDRPDVGKVVLPELNRLRALAEENIPSLMFAGSMASSPNQSQISKIQEVFNDEQSGYDSSRSRTSISSFGDRMQN